MNQFLEKNPSLIILIIIFSCSPTEGTTTSQALASSAFMEKRKGKIATKKTTRKTFTWIANV